jgi:transposase
LKLLVFDGSGLVLATKWLEDGDFAWPPVREGTCQGRDPKGLDG